MGTNEIGRLISDNIHEYIRTANDKILDEIFRSLVVVGSRILRQGYSKEVDSYILDEVNYEAAEDIVLTIMKDPGLFKDNSNFVPYYRKVLKNDCLDLFRRNKRLVENFVHVDVGDGIDTEISLQGTVRNPEDALIIRDEVRSI